MGSVTGRDPWGEGLQIIWNAMVDISSFMLKKKKSMPKNIHLHTNSMIFKVIILNITHDQHFLTLI